MFPEQTTNNATDLATMNSIDSSQFGLVNSARVISSSDLNNLALGKFDIATILALCCIHVPVATFKVSISHIIQMSSKKKMIRLNASRHVTMMKDKQTFRNWTKVKNPTNSVSMAESWSRRSEGVSDPSITPPINAGCPKPTVFRFKNLLPKPSRQVKRKTLRYQIFRSNFNLHISNALGDRYERPKGFFNLTSFTQKGKVACG